MANTTLVSTSRLKDFELFRTRIGCLLPSYLSEPPAGCLRISVPNTEVSKTEWSELYEVIGGKDGTNPNNFVLPYKAKEGDLEYYLVGKVLISDITESGNVVTQTFTKQDLTKDGYFIFKHGIGHTNPILQVLDGRNGQVLVTETLNSVGQSSVLVEGYFHDMKDAVYTILAIG